MCWGIVWGRGLGCRGGRSGVRGLGSGVWGLEYGPLGFGVGIWGVELSCFGSRVESLVLWVSHFHARMLKVVDRFGSVLQNTG